MDREKSPDDKTGRKRESRSRRQFAGQDGAGGLKNKDERHGIPADESGTT